LISVRHRFQQYDNAGSPLPRPEKTTPMLTVFWSRP
jgi:hypothetical protein